MPEAFSFNREFDFVRLDGLNRVTGRSAHEWDIYIIKELLDNGIDADEMLWSKNPATFPKISIDIAYIDLPDRRRQLIIQVENRAPFPVDLLESIFNTSRYTSRKAFVKGLTRGSLGNALKTLLGIPYVLRKKSAGDFVPELIPLSIKSGGKEYLPQYEVDSAAQTITLRTDVKEAQNTEGTIVRIGIDHYRQEMPRTLEQLHQLANQYHLCNPHTEFKWSIELDGQTHLYQYLADTNWRDKYQGKAPIHWYDPVGFQDLLHALYREEASRKTNPVLSMATVWSFINMHEETSPDQSLPNFHQTAFHIEDIQSRSTELYQQLYKQMPQFKISELGRIGQDHISAFLSKEFDIDDQILYSYTESNDDPSIPFILEISAAKAKDGKRRIWTAINFTPTYGDPFSRRWLYAPTKPDSPLMGLHGFADSYGFDEEKPLVLFVHLVCPTVEHGEYSKTEINHLPFRDALGTALHTILNQLIEREREKDLKIEQTVYAALDEILDATKPNERFVADQLLEKLLSILIKKPELQAWLGTPDILERLKMYITDYQSSKPVVTQWARPASEITLPLHPNRHFSIPANQINHELLKAYHVNKQLYIHAREIEPVVIENGWLCQFDMALIRNPANSDDLEGVISYCMSNNDYPLLVLHNADEKGYQIIHQIRSYVIEHLINPARIIDVGLMQQSKTNEFELPSRLVQLMPGELEKWMLTRFHELRIPIKNIPYPPEIRKDMKSYFEHLLLSHVWEGMAHQLHVANLLDKIDEQHNIANLMQEHKLDEQLTNRLLNNICMDSYEIQMKELTTRFYEDFMMNYGIQISETVQLHLSQYAASTRAP